VSYETIFERNCFDGLLPRKIILESIQNNEISKFIGLSLLGSKFWTSISNEGPDIKEYLQCASNLNKAFIPDLLNVSFWANAIAKTQKLQRCLAYKSSKSDPTVGFIHESCDKVSLPYICEVGASIVSSKNTQNCIVATLPRVILPTNMFFKCITKISQDVKRLPNIFKSYRHPFLMEMEKLLVRKPMHCHKVH
jgi:hypothetical protein